MSIGSTEGRKASVMHTRRRNKALDEIDPLSDSLEGRRMETAMPFTSNIRGPEESVDYVKIA